MSAISALFGKLDLSSIANIVGVSLAVGIGFSMVPYSLAAFPFWASSLLSGVLGTALTAIILSLLLKEDKMDDDTQKGDEEE